MIGSQRCTGSHQKSQCDKAPAAESSNPRDAAPAGTSKVPKRNEPRASSREASDWPFEQQKATVESGGFSLRGGDVSGTFAVTIAIQSRIG